MLKPLISIIVPVYNVEQYLDKCIESIVSQTYQNLEIILVDDGSTDTCPSICDNWSKIDARIMVIHKENGGLSDARNAGIEVANGTLIGFIDSDDYIRNDMYELLYKSMIENNSDISACGIKLFWEDGTPPRMLTKEGCYCLNTEEAMLAVVQESHLIQPVVYKLYKSHLIKDILFPIGKYHEDVFWTYRAVSRAKRVSVFDAPCYFYLQRCNSIMGENFTLKRLDALEGEFLRLKFIEDYFPQLVPKTVVRFWFGCIYLMQMSIKWLPSNERELAKQRIVDYINSVSSAGVFSFCTLKEKVWFIMSKMSFVMTCKFRNFLNIGF